MSFISIKPRCQCEIKPCWCLHDSASAPFGPSLTRVGQCPELSGDGHSGCLTGLVLLSELPHKCAHVWLALAVSSDLLWSPQRGGRTLVPFPPNTFMYRSMSSTGKGDIPLLGNTSTDWWLDRVTWGTDILENPVFQHYSIRQEEGLGSQPSKMSQRQGAGYQELDTTELIMFGDSLLTWPLQMFWFPAPLFHDVEKLHAWRCWKHLGIYGQGMRFSGSQLGFYL